MPRLTAIFTLPERVHEVGPAVRAVLLCMKDNPYFPTPLPPLADVEALVVAYEAANVGAMTRALGLAADRDSQLDLLRSKCSLLRAYVQNIANANLTEGAAVIESAGMSVKRSSAHGRPPLRVKMGALAGTVRMYCRAPGDRVVYEWKVEEEDGSFARTFENQQASLDVDGLTPGHRYSVQVRTSMKSAFGPWGSAVRFRVPLPPSGVTTPAGTPLDGEDDDAEEVEDSPEAEEPED